MDSITAINIVRDTLRTYLTDPYYLAGGTSRDGSTWIFSDEPNQSPKYPKIQLLKLNNPSFPITIGPNYWETEEVFINIWFYSKNGFKATVDGTEYLNAQLVEYYLGQIKSLLKSKFEYMFNLGAKEYIAVNTTNPAYDPNTQLHYGAVTVRVRFFRP